MTLLAQAHRLLVGYAAVMALAMLMTCLWAKHDLRTIGGVGVWRKPLKFMASTGLFALTTLWLMTISGVADEGGRSLSVIAILVVCTSTFEVAYITFQAARGEASHYNESDQLHALLFRAMAIAALGLTSSQAWLAVLVWEHAVTSTHSTSALGIVAGLAMTFVLGTISGVLLGGRQPPIGAGLPIVGWHRRNDLRPAHFLGIHAQQIVPAFGLLAERLAGGAASLVLAAFAILYLLAWFGITQSGLARVGGEPSPA